MILCIDSGNTRIKWGIHDGQEWLASGVLLHVDANQLQQLTAIYPQPSSILLANVAGERAKTNIAHHLQCWTTSITEVKATLKQAGVTNFYKNPEQLGVDRWCAMIGAWQSLKTACVVVMAGTATTIDSLDNQGNFLGGLILPGSDLMCYALSHGTADLKWSEGNYQTYPQCTHDAIFSGTTEAQVGAIERTFHRLLPNEKSCILSGGNAKQLAPHLAIPFTLVQNLPLEGLLVLSRENNRE